MQLYGIIIGFCFANSNKDACPRYQHNRVFATVPFAVCVFDYARSNRKSQFIFGFIHQQAHTFILSIVLAVFNV